MPLAHVTLTDGQYETYGVLLFILAAVIAAGLINWARQPSGRHTRTARPEWKWSDQPETAWPDQQYYQRTASAAYQQHPAGQTAQHSPYDWAREDIW